MGSLIMEVGGTWMTSPLAPCSHPAASVSSVPSSSQKDPVKTSPSALGMSLLHSEPSHHSPVLSEKESNDPGGPQGPNNSASSPVPLSLPAVSASLLPLEPARRAPAVVPFVPAVPLAWNALPHFLQVYTLMPPSQGGLPGCSSKMSTLPALSHFSSQ